MTTDPVWGMKVDEKNHQYQPQFAGRKYAFCSEDCKKEFDKRPEEYFETAE